MCLVCEFSTVLRTVFCVWQCVILYGALCRTCSAQSQNTHAYTLILYYLYMESGRLADCILKLCNTSADSRLKWRTILAAVRLTL